MLSCSALKTEYLKNPVGIDEKIPRFSWKLQSDQTDVQQTAYQIVVEGMWDTGRIEGAAAPCIEYAGEPLLPRTRYAVKVKVWDNHREESDWAEGFFETGFLGYKELWQAKWLEPMIEGDAAPVIEKRFFVKEMPKQARLYATAYGVYEVHLNGYRVSDSYLAPGFTSYKKRLQYQTYEVEPYLVPGENEIRIYVATGWCNGRIESLHGCEPYRQKNAVLAQLMMRGEDGDITVATDETWQCRESKLRFCDMYDGEVYDNDFVSCDSVPLCVRDYGYENLIGQICEPVRVIQKLPPKALIHTPKGETVLDFGQNLVGWVNFRVSGSCGSRVELSHAEVLDRDGNFYTDNLRSARQKITYILRGEGEESYHAKMSFQGFRYVRLDAYPAEAALSDFEAHVISTDMERIGHFQSSSDLLNRLYENVIWGQRGNFVDIPTDCPQRDERMGWTGDAQVFCKTAVQNMMSARFFEKWLGDLAADQAEDGGCPNIVPSMGVVETSAGWGDAAVICPWEVYFAYGDRRMLARQYPSMKAWVEYIRAQGDNPYLWDTGFQYGDWLALDTPSDVLDGGTDKAYLASAFYAGSARLLSKAAAALEKWEDAKHYRDLYQNIVENIRKTYVSPDGRLLDQTQTAHAIALQFGLCEDQKQTARALYDLVCANGDKLTTGFLGTPYLCDALSENGYPQKAFDLILQEEYPSWLYAVKMGATTIWEHWDGIRPDGTFWSESMNSFNHYAYGAVASFFYQKIGGIVPIEPGYRKIRIQPMPDRRISYAKAAIDTVYGVVKSEWQTENGTFFLTVTVPCNTTAEICLPDGTVHRRGSGCWRFTCADTDEM